MDGDGDVGGAGYRWDRLGIACSISGCTMTGMQRVATARYVRQPKPQPDGQRQNCGHTQRPQINAFDLSLSSV